MKEISYALNKDLPRKTDSFQNVPGKQNSLKELLQWNFRRFKI